MSNVRPQKVAATFQHQVPEEHLRHIGDITVSFALLEHCTRSLAQSILGAGQRLGQAVTAELSFKVLRSMTISLYLQQYSEDENSEELRQLIRRAAEVEEKRNQITHSLWAGSSEPGSITRMKTTAKEKHGVRFHYEDVTSARLEGFAQEIKTLASDITVFLLLLVKAGKANAGY